MTVHNCQEVSSRFTLNEKLDDNLENIQSVYDELISLNAEQQVWAEYLINSILTKGYIAAY